MNLQNRELILILLLMTQNLIRISELESSFKTAVRSANQVIQFHNYAKIADKK
jgi:hypothetical protein